MNRGVVRDDHDEEVSAFHRAAHRVQVRDVWEVAAVLAQEQVHVFVVVVAEVLRLDGLVFGWERGGVGGACLRGGWRRASRHAEATGGVTDHRRQSEVQHCGLDVRDGHVEDGHGREPGTTGATHQGCFTFQLVLVSVGSRFACFYCLFK